MALLLPLANGAQILYLRHRMKFASFLLLPFFGAVLVFTAAAQAPPAAGALTTNDVIVAEKLFGLDLPADKLRMMLPGLRAQQRDYTVIRQIAVSNSVLPAVLFNPIPSGMTFETKRLKPEWSPALRLAAPAHLEDAAFYSVGQLAALLKSRQITSSQLTRMYLDRLKKYGPKLNCVVTLDGSFRPGPGRPGQPGNRRRPLSRPAPRHSLRRQGFAGRQRSAHHLGRRSLHQSNV